MPPAPTYHVLLVEDDPDTSRLLARRLAWSRPSLFVVERVPDLQSAFACLERKDYDALLLDLSLPDGDAMSTISTAAAVTLRIPVVILTACDDDDLALLAARIGIQDYQIKTKLDARQLVRSVLAAIHRYRWSRRLAGMAAA
jgi:DNA-binding response OmpR family regulator